MPVGVVPSVREEPVGPVHTTSTVTPSTISSHKLMEQVRARLEPGRIEDEDEKTFTEGERTARECKYCKEKEYIPVTDSLLIPKGN